MAISVHLMQLTGYLESLYNELIRVLHLKYLFLTGQKAFNDNNWPEYKAV
jgi:hypothetical protein